MASSLDTDEEPTQFAPKTLGNEWIGADDISRTYSERPSNPSDEETGEEKTPKQSHVELSRTPTTKSLPNSHGFFSRKLAKERRILVLTFLKNWAIMVTCLLLIFSIYWGALYERASHYKNVRMLLVVEDVEVDGIPPLIGQTAIDVAKDPLMVINSDFHIYSGAEFQAAYDKNDNQPFNATQEINHLIHHQHYWVAVYVKANTTYSLYQALKTANTSFDPTADTDISVDAIYETGRDALAMNSSVLPLLQYYQYLFNPTILAEQVYAPIITNNLTNDERSNLINTAPQLISNVPSVRLVDNLPITNTTLLAPCQVGMIFLIILTFFQFNFFAPVHQIIAPRIRKQHFVIYRMVSAQLSYFVISLAYCWVSLAFQVDFSVTFGNAGFLVYWMTSFLTMSAVGGANENMALFIIPFYAPLIGFWLIFWVISNISSAFFALAVLPDFYRYGYFYPLHNAAELFKVIFNNSYKGEMGRNYGVLIAWIAVNNAILPFALKSFGTKMAAKAAAAQKK
ncbi:Sng1 protein [Saccharomycopsis crataegensis]|uniref:Sng1 protein n=1 Tax=Saccharomycopsis crataegensis TaxID=43959 RepID=A0AAV5QUM1_9ASCO|nr:Sng1 protein [Saccharomycopsis crataegensis]